MECKDCIHEELCMDRLSKQGYSMYTNRSLIIEGCEYFKNKAEYAEVKHGEWIPIVKQDDYLEPPYCDTIKCSECGQEADVSFHEAPYCFRCGAKMDGRGKERE